MYTVSDQAIDALAQTTTGPDDPVVLIAHSGASALLPPIGPRLPVPVSSYLFVNAGLPRSGSSWIESIPAPAVDRRRHVKIDRPR